MNKTQKSDALKLINCYCTANCAVVVPRPQTNTHKTFIGDLLNSLNDSLLSTFTLLLIKCLIITNPLSHCNRSI